MKKGIAIGIICCVLQLVSCGKKEDGIHPVRRNITEMVFASGVLEADDQYTLSAEADGYLVDLRIKEGDLVKAGQLLGSIDNHENVINAVSAERLHEIARENASPDAPAFLEIEANIKAARAKLDLDRLQEERYERLMASNSISRLEYENARLNAESARQALNALLEQYRNQLRSARQEEVSQRYKRAVNEVVSGKNQVRAIHAGMIYQKLKQAGDYVRKGDAIAVMGNPKIIYARLNVDETSMAQLKPGQLTMIRLNTDKSKTYAARVRDIFPAFDAASQSFIVKAYFSDRLDFRVTGTQLEANIVIRTRKNVLVIPTSYLDYGNKVTLKKTHQQVIIKPGIISDQWVEILGGLTDQDILIPNQH